ncbi:hypothetical protein AB1L88_12565 [Tautonia sp. JC769]|uniref:hypothetical protein n=1 Tax=Tautonia sp. JC769 TaxID=3232135 RepID=UPI003458F826
MNRRPPSKPLVLLLLPLVLALAGSAHAGVVTHLTFADKGEGNSAFFSPNHGLTPDASGNLLSGQQVTLDGITLLVSAAGGVNLGTGNVINPQRLHLSHSGVGVRGGSSGSLHAGESLSFQSETLLTLTGLSFIRPAGSPASPFSFDLLVDDQGPVTGLLGETSALNRFESLDRFAFNVTGNSFTIRTTGGEGRLAQFSVMADPGSLVGVVAVPEPSTLALAACGAALGLFCYGRSRGRPGRDRAAD